MRSIAWTRPILDAVKILHRRGTSWWKLVTLIICVEFKKIDGSDLEGLVLDVDLVISENSFFFNIIATEKWSHFMGSRYPSTSLGYVGSFEI